MPDEHMEWVEALPPAKAGRKRGSAWDAKREALKANPGCWARIATGVRNAGSVGYIRRVLGVGCVVAMRQQDDGTFDVYAVYEPSKVGS